MKRLPILLLAWLLPATVVAGWRVEGGPGRAVLIELFTSEGCSSCPPAEAWLNRLTAHPDLWRVYVPVARHVGYWDYLGWPDPYARPEHAAAQQRYARSGGLPGVYTPALVANGRSWRPGWLPQRLPEADGVAGRLVVEIDADRFQARYEVPAGDDANEGLQLNLAVLGMGLESDIAAGENRGRKSRHEFVALAVAQFDSADGQWSGQLPQAGPEPGAGAYALAAWVTRRGDPTPLQAAGGIAPPPGRRP